MKTLFVVKQIRGQAWDWTKPLRSQAQWDSHAAFMDELAASGFVVLGGPLGDDGEAMLVIDAPYEEAVEATLGRDPWRQSGMLLPPDIQRWTILLEGAKEK